MNKRDIGKLGENIAVKFFEDHNIEIIDKNYFTKFGEIDLIGIENKTIIFIEVKLRYSNSFGVPYEAVTELKLDRLRKSALCYLADKEISDTDCRFDIVSLLYSPSDESFKIDWLKDYVFFDE